MKLINWSWNFDWNVRHHNWSWSSIRMLIIYNLNASNDRIGGDRFNLHIAFETKWRQENLCYKSFRDLLNFQIFIWFCSYATFECTTKSYASHEINEEWSTIKRLKTSGFSNQLSSFFIGPFDRRELNVDRPEHENCISSCSSKKKAGELIYYVAHSFVGLLLLLIPISKCIHSYNQQ